MADTLRALGEGSPGDELVLILGADQASALVGWHEPEAVLELATVAVAAREGMERESVLRRVEPLAGSRADRVLRDAATGHLLHADPRARRRRRADPLSRPRRCGRLHRSPVAVRSVRPGGGRASPEQLADRIAQIASDRKAIDIRVLDLRGVVGYTDYFVVCSGNTERQTKAIHDAVYQELKDEEGLLPAPRRGRRRGTLDPARLPRRGAARLHARGARVLPPGEPLGRRAAAVCGLTTLTRHGAVAQLARAFGCGLKGRGFESPQLHSPTRTLVAVAQAGEQLHNTVSGEQLVFRRLAGDTGGELLEFDWCFPAGGSVPPHVHGHQEERFQILSGRARFRIAGSPPEGRGRRAGCGAARRRPRDGAMPARMSSGLGSSFDPRCEPNSSSTPCSRWSATEGWTGRATPARCDSRCFWTSSATRCRCPGCRPRCRGDSSRLLAALGRRRN